MNIVTGYTGTPHITANEAQALNQGILGSGNYVLDVGQKFSATIVDANNITIEDGEGVMQGVQFRIAPGETENVTIENGTIGYLRNDLICARYTKDAYTGIESVELVVIQGTSVVTSPEDPEYNTGDILSGDSPVDFPLYRVSLDGITPSLTRVYDDRVKVLTKSETVTTEQKGSSWRARSSITNVSLKAGTYIISIRSATSASNAPTPKTLYMSLSADPHDYVKQEINNNSEIASVDIITLSSPRVAVFLAETYYSQSNSVNFDTTVRIYRLI